MAINHWVRALLIVAALLTAPKVLAQQPHCKDSAEHIRLREAMWASCKQDSQQVVYDACMAYLAHAKEDGDMLEVSSSWVCGIMYSLGKMNISSAYHIAQGLKAEIMSGPFAEEGQYFISNMMGHVYNTCGNIPGAEAEFLKSAEQIKGTSFEVDGLAFIYLAIAHVHLNNSLKQTLHWLDVTEEELEKNKGSWNYYRCLADVYAIRAIVRFKQKNFDAFRQCIAKMDEAEKMNKVPSGDLFTPYARIYQTLLEKGSTQALAEADSLNNLKEQYLLKCDIYRYIGADDKAFLTQRELMHKRDSITGLMIAENIDRVEEEMELMRRSHKMGRLMNYVLVGAMVLLILAIILLHRNILIRRKFSKRLIAKNEELRAAYKHVAAADEMKTEFIRNVSHEIRTPLNIINGFTQVLADQGSDMGDTERKAISNTIGNSTRQITSLVNKMLALANEHTKDLLKDVEETDALDICHKALSAMPPVNPDRVSLELVDQAEGHSKTLTTNSDSLLQMLGNILENSAKFTDDGYIRLILSKDKNYFHFTIEDTGCGIPSDKIGTIFNRFTKVDEFKEGLGLGLAYCHETVAKLGGTLVLDQTSAAGTTFTLSLPIKLKTNN